MYKSIIVSIRSTFNTRLQMQVGHIHGIFVRAEVTDPGVFRETETEPDISVGLDPNSDLVCP